MSEHAVRSPRSRPATRQLWSERLERFRASGLSVVAFCKAEGICSHSFYYWKRLLAAPAEAPAAPRLLPVRLQPAGAAIEVVLPTGPTLRLPHGCDLDFVRSLVAALGDKPC
jgi:hypothetical protein